MVVSLPRFLNAIWLRSASPSAPRHTAVDLSRFSAHDLADLNLPPEIRARIGLKQSREHGMGRW